MQTQPSFFFRTLFLSTVWLTASLGTAVARAGSPVQRSTAGLVRTLTHCPPRPQDEVWLVSTRRLGGLTCGRAVAPRWDMFRHAGCNGWQPLDPLAAESRPAASTLTIVYTHGYDMDWQTAINRGLVYYQTIAAHARPDERLRFVIWSWPSDRERFILTDLREKARRTDADALYLASFLSRTTADKPVSLIGYSYGARITTGALHVLNGGLLFGQTVEAGPARPPMRAVLLAAAATNDSLLPNGEHGRALDRVDRLLLLYNSHDPILRQYSILDPCCKPQALGFTGQCGADCLGPLAERFRQRDVCCEAGNKHHESGYYAPPTIRCQFANFALWRDDDDRTR